MTDFNISRLDAVARALRSIESELSLPLLLTLTAVARHPGISVNELAQQIDVPQQTASRYVSILQGRYQMLDSGENSFARNPYLSLTVSAVDPRRRAIFLTSRGKGRLAEIIQELYNQEAAEGS